MAIHLWSVLCQNAIIDKRSNNLTLYSILEEIKGVVPLSSKNKGDVTFLPIPAQLITSLVRSNPDEPEENIDIGINLKSPDGREFKIENVAKSNLIDHTRSRHIISLENIPYTVAGVYWLHIQVTAKGKRKQVAKIPLEINITFASANS